MSEDDPDGDAAIISDEVEEEDDDDRSAIAMPAYDRSSQLPPAARSSDSSTSTSTEDAAVAGVGSGAGHGRAARFLHRESESLVRRLSDSDTVFDVEERRQRFEAERKRRAASPTALELLTAGSGTAAASSAQQPPSLAAQDATGDRNRTATPSPPPRLHGRGQSAMQLSPSGVAALAGAVGSSIGGRGRGSSTRHSSPPLSAKRATAISPYSRGSRRGRTGGGSRASKGGRKRGPPDLCYLWGSGRLPGLIEGEKAPSAQVDIRHSVFRGKRVIQVACGMGSRQALFLTGGGDVYRASGVERDEWGQTAVHEGTSMTGSMALAGGTAGDTGTTTVTKKLHPAAAAASGLFAAALTPADAAAAKVVVATKMRLREPKLVQDFAWERALGRCTVVGVACGAVHCCALADGGQVFTWGKASLGRLGTHKHWEHSQEVVAPKLVLPLVGIRIVDIQCGESHTIAREIIARSGGGTGAGGTGTRKGGRLFSWGNGANGRLGHGDTRIQPLPKEIRGLAQGSSRSASNDSNGLAAGDPSLAVSLPAGAQQQSVVGTSKSPLVVSVSCGWTFSGAVTLDGGVLLWGRGQEGQLGIESMGQDRTKPVPVRHPMVGTANGMRPWSAHTISCGLTHSLVLCERHPISVLQFVKGMTAADMNRPTAVFSLGFGERGELGLAKPHVPALEQIRFEELMPGDTVVAVSTGSQHCGAVSHFGAMFVWGCNRHGALGLPKHGDQWTPMLVVRVVVLAVVFPSIHVCIYTIVCRLTGFPLPPAPPCCIHTNNS